MKNIKAALIDLYNNEENLGISAIQRLLAEFDGKVNGQPLSYQTFETRYKAEIPDLSYDIYISSGGRGSPFEGEGTVWEIKQKVIEDHGEHKYEDILEKLEDPEKVALTQKEVLPTFFRTAIESLTKY